MQLSELRWRCIASLGGDFWSRSIKQALERAFQLQNLPYKRENQLTVYYRGSALNTCYKADFIGFRSIMVELKARAQLTGREESQVINYLKAAGLNKGRLFNFGASSLQHKRLVYNLRESAQSADQPEGPG